MNYSAIKYNAIEDGIGIRTVLFVSGCRRHCPGCFQPQTWDFSHGEPFTKEVRDRIIASLKSPYVNGLTLLGGEPFEPENQKTLALFTDEVRDKTPESTIWAYSGFTFDELFLRKDSQVRTQWTNHLLGNLDILVDGPFMESLASKMLPYRGSSNQRVIDVRASMESGLIIVSPYGERHGRSSDAALSQNMHN